MKILHFSDLHLGLDNYSTPTANGLSTRVEDNLAALDVVVETAILERVDLVLFTGDAYHMKNPSQTLQREYARRLWALSERGINVMLLVGNHDQPADPGKATTLAIFDLARMPGIYIAGIPDLHYLPTKSGPIQIAALPWQNKYHLNLAPGATFQDMSRVLRATVERFFHNVASQRDPNVPLIMGAHLSASTAMAGSEMGMMMSLDPEVSVDVLADSLFDYVGLGHIHKAQMLHVLGKGRPPVVYAGSTQPVDFGEEGEKKGFYMVELDTARAAGQRVTSVEFRPVGGPEFVTVAVNLRAEGDSTEQILNEIAGRPVAGNIVRVQVNATSAQKARIREVELRRALANARYQAGISIDVERARRPRHTDASLSLAEKGPLDNLRLFAQAQGYSPERTEELVARAQELMETVQ